MQNYLQTDLIKRTNNNYKLLIKNEDTNLNIFAIILHFKQRITIKSDHYLVIDRKYCSNLKQVFYFRKQYGKSFD